jgi:hypothetical protein
MLQTPAIKQPRIRWLVNPQVGEVGRKPYSLLPLSFIAAKLPESCFASAEL